MGLRITLSPEGEHGYQELYNGSDTYQMTNLANSTYRKGLANLRATLASSCILPDKEGSSYYDFTEVTPLP